MSNSDIVSVWLFITFSSEFSLNVLAVTLEHQFVYARWPIEMTSQDRRILMHFRTYFKLLRLKVSKRSRFTEAAF